MKYLELLTKEEMIDVLKKKFSEDELYEIVLDTLKKRSYLLHKEHEQFRNNFSGYDAYEKSYSILKSMVENNEKIIEVQTMSIRENRSKTYEEILSEEKAERERKTKEFNEKYWAEMEKKYGL